MSRKKGDLTELNKLSNYTVTTKSVSSSNSLSRSRSISTRHPYKRENKKTAVPFMDYSVNEETSAPESCAKQGFLSNICLFDVAAISAILAAYFIGPMYSITLLVCYLLAWTRGK